MPHSAQSQHTNYWAPRTRKRHQQEHRRQRPTEHSDPTQHAKGRTGDRPGPRKGATTRRNVTQGASSGDKYVGKASFCSAVSKISPRKCSSGHCLLFVHRQRGLLFVVLSSLMSWSCSKFGTAKVSRNRSSTRHKGSGVSKFPASDGPPPKLEVCRNHGGGGRARSLYANPPRPKVLTDSGGWVGRIRTGGSRPPPPPKF